MFNFNYSTDGFEAEKELGLESETQNKYLFPELMETGGGEIRAVGFVLPTNFLNFSGILRQYSPEMLVGMMQYSENSSPSSLTGNTSFNNGWDFIWYRDDDIQMNTDNNLFTGTMSFGGGHFTSGYINYPTGHDPDGSSSFHQEGRGGILTLPKKVKVLNILGPNPQYTLPENLKSNIPSNFYVKPLDGKQFLNLVSNNGNLQDFIYNTPLGEESADFEGTGTVVSQSDVIGTGSNSSRIAGKFVLNDNVSAEEVDKVLFFDTYNDGTDNEFNYDSLAVGQNQTTGVWKNFLYKGGPTCIAYEEEIDTDDDVYISAEGRHNYLATESLLINESIMEWQEQNLTADDITMSIAINGADNTIPTDFGNWINSIEEVLKGLSNINMWNYPYSTLSLHGWLGEVDSSWMPIAPPLVSATLGSTVSLFETSYDSFGLGISDEYSYVIDDFNIFNTDNNKIMQLTNIWKKVFMQCYWKMMQNALEYEAREYVAEQIASGNTIYFSANFAMFGQGGSSPSYPYDNATMNEDALGYENYRRYILNEIMLYVWAAGTGSEYDIPYFEEVNVEHSHFTDLWHYKYADHRKAMYRRLLKLFYQSELNTDEVDSMFNFQVDWHIENLDDSDSIYDFTRLLSNEYIDDILNTINKDIFDYKSVEGEERNYLYKDTMIYNEGNESEYGADDLEDEIRIYGADFNYRRETDGVVNKPIDIIVDILSREVGFGLKDNNLYDKSKYDLDSIESSRNFYKFWKLGFCISKKIEAKKLIEEILSETMSFFTFNPEGKFSLITIKDKYNYDDIDHFIKEQNVIKYNFKRTKREDLVFSNKFNYRYDNGKEEYPLSTPEMKIKNILPDYDGYYYYNIEEDTGFGEIKKDLRYHTETETVLMLQKYHLLNNCNLHIIAELELSLSHTDIKVGDIIHIPLLENNTVFGLDYSKVQTLNSQPIYPAFIVTSVDLRLDRIAIKAYQLHYLGTDGHHEFALEGETLSMVANLNMYNTDRPEILNWNYLPISNRHPDYTYIQGIEIPYGDITADGTVNVIDVVGVVNHVLGITPINEGDSSRISNYDFINNTINSNPDQIDINKVIQLVDILLGD